MVMGNIIGDVFGVIILIAGNLFNLCINSLGGFVHSARLQYIESFNKFFVGGGRVMKPLAYNTRNNRVVG